MKTEINTIKDDAVKMQEAEFFYASLLVYVKFIFKEIKRIDYLDIPSIFNRVKMIYKFIRYNRRYLMRVQHPVEPPNGEEYIISHSVRTAIVAMIIGIYFRLPGHRLLDLGVASLLHDIGMLSLPQELYFNSRLLTDQEKKLIQTHPIRGCKLLQSNNFSLAVKLAVLEHHERENGSGYPRNLKGESISLYGKIIAVACSYEAISAKRLHRESKDRHEGILELLKNKEKQYDENVIRALVYSLSIYPPGMHVLLSNGKKGQVVDVNPENPRYPVVLLFDNQLTSPKDDPLIQTSPESVSIARPLKHNEF